MISAVFDTTAVSLYQPSKEERDVTAYAKEAYDRGYRLLTQAWPELNDRSIKDDEQNGKKIWNAYVDDSCDDPFESWKWRGTRSEARKRGVAMHAQLTSGFLFAGISAQDPDSKEDRNAGDFMRGIVEWMAENSDYLSSYIQVTMGMMMNPVTYMGAEYAQVMQKVKVKLAEGYDTKEVLDEELSGFRAPVYGATDIMINNAYEQNIQRQTCVIKNRSLDYADAKKRYGNHPNWSYVQKGVMAVFNETDNLFYDVRDHENPDFVKETIVQWRGEDLEIPFLGGVYMGDENTGFNPFKFRSVRNQPMYDVVPFGYNRISEHFFYFKSLMNTLQWEDSFADEFSRNLLNRELLNINVPTFTVGDEDNSVNTSVIFPGANVTSRNKDFQVKPILPPQQGNPYAALKDVRDSIEANSISDVQSGQLPPGSTKATAIVQATNSGRTLLKGLGRSLGQSIVQYTNLMVTVGIRNLSIAQVDEITGSDYKTRYRQFTLPKRMSRGKLVGKTLRFDGELVGKKMTKKDIEYENARLLEETEGNEKSTIISLNPEMAPRMKYLISYDPEELFTQNQQQMQIMMQNMYAQLRADPLVDAEVLLREYLYAFFRSKGDDFVKALPMAGALPSPFGEEGGGQQKMPTPVAPPAGMLV